MSEVKIETEVNSHEYVDLGLPSGRLWATMNVGANGSDGNYWSSSHGKSNLDKPCEARYLFFYSNGHSLQDFHRCGGRSIRPVRSGLRKK